MNLTLKPLDTGYVWLRMRRWITAFVWTKLQLIRQLRVLRVLRVLRGPRHRPLLTEALKLLPAMLFKGDYLQFHLITIKPHKRACHKLSGYSDLLSAFATTETGNTNRIYIPSALEHRWFLHLLIREQYTNQCVYICVYCLSKVRCSDAGCNNWVSHLTTKSHLPMKSLLTVKIHLTPLFRHCSRPRLYLSLSNERELQT